MTIYEQLMCILIITILMAATVSLGLAAGRYVQNSTSNYVGKLNQISRPG